MGGTIRLLGLALLSVLAGVGLTWLGWDRGPRRTACWPVLPPLEKAVLVQKHTLARDALAREVIAKEMGLFDAAVWFRRFNEEAGYHQESYWQRLPGKCDDEKACRQVITWVRRRLEEVNMPTSQVEAIVGDLEEELEEHLSESGRVILPDLP
jgi:hypothetical protein